MLGKSMHLLNDSSPLWKPGETPRFATHSSNVRLDPIVSERGAPEATNWFLSASRETSDGGREEEGPAACSWVL